MTTADIIARTLRPIAPQQKFSQGEVDLMNAIAASWDARGVALRPKPDPLPTTKLPDPAWVLKARDYIGQKEIKGPQHNEWIAKGWKLLGAGWFNDDETPWCGYFVARCLHDVGLPYPSNFPSAASFATYGEACTAQLGAIGVKKRKGGNHVFFIVGITADGKYYKALGGNQSDMVNIVDIPVNQVTHIRWPSAQPKSGYLPIMKAGTLATREA